MFVLFFHVCVEKILYNILICNFSNEGMALTVSTLTLTAIALERLLAVKYPLAVRRMERKNTRIIAVIWLGAVLVSLPFMIFRQLATVHVSASRRARPHMDRTTVRGLYVNETFSRGLIDFTSVQCKS